MTDPRDQARAILTREAVLAMPAGRQMDALIETLVMKSVPCEAWVFNGFDSRHGQLFTRREPPCEHRSCYPTEREVGTLDGHMLMAGGDVFIGNFSTEITVAWRVIEEFRARDWSFKMTYGRTGVRCSFMNMPLRGFVFAEADTVPLAICRAALLTTVPA